MKAAARSTHEPYTGEAGCYHVTSQICDEILDVNPKLLKALMEFARIQDVAHSKLYNLSQFLKTAMAKASRQSTPRVLGGLF